MSKMSFQFLEVFFGSLCQLLSSDDVECISIYFENYKKVEFVDLT